MQMTMNKKLFTYISSHIYKLSNSGDISIMNLSIEMNQWEAIVDYYSNQYFDQQELRLTRLGVDFWVRVSVLSNRFFFSFSFLFTYFIIFILSINLSLFWFYLRLNFRFMFTFEVYVVKLPISIFLTPSNTGKLCIEIDVNKKKIRRQRMLKIETTTLEWVYSYC